MLWALSRDRLTARQRARYDRLGLCSPRETSKATCEGYGYLKVGKSLGIGTGTVQRIAKELR
jgi:hypothetical protein